MNLQNKTETYNEDDGFVPSSPSYSPEDEEEFHKNENKQMEPLSPVNKTPITQAHPIKTFTALPPLPNFPPPPQFYANQNFPPPMFPPPPQQMPAYFYQPQMPQYQIHPSRMREQSWDDAQRGVLIRETKLQARKSDQDNQDEIPTGHFQCPCKSAFKKTHPKVLERAWECRECHRKIWAMEALDGKKAKQKTNQNSYRAMSEGFNNMRRN